MKKETLEWLIERIALLERIVIGIVENDDSALTRIDSEDWDSLTRGVRHEPR